jgi:hypothetical protein
MYPARSWSRSHNTVWFPDDRSLGAYTNPRRRRRRMLMTMMGLDVRYSGGANVIFYPWPGVYSSSVDYKSSIHDRGDLKCSMGRNRPRSSDRMNRSQSSGVTWTCVQPSPGSRLASADTTRHRVLTIGWIRMWRRR